MNLVERVKNILLTPQTEWPVIDKEETTIGGLITGYVMILALIPAIAGILGSLVFGKFGLVFGLISAVFGYVIAIASIYIVAFIIDALATTFGGTKNMVQAAKVAAYSYTAAWVAGVLNIIPIAGGILAMLGSLYGLYLLYLGLPMLMKAPADKAIPYTLVTIVCLIVVTVILGLILGGIMALGLIGGGAAMLH
jgi:hypothetical protein